MPCFIGAPYGLRMTTQRQAPQLRSRVCQGSSWQRADRFWLTLSRLNQKYSRGLAVMHSHVQLEPAPSRRLQGDRYRTPPGTVLTRIVALEKGVEKAICKQGIVFK
jgi:hypothetical protein